MLPALAHFAWQSVVLAGMVGALFALQTLAGGWIVLAFFPRRDALRWPIYAPIAGMAFFTAAGLPLAMLGLPVSRFAPVLAIVGTVLTLAYAWRLRRSDSGTRVLGMFLRLRGLRCAAVVAVVLALSTYIIVGRNPVSVVGASGSGDYGAYWVVADYLQDHGATVSAYESQQVFHSSDVLDHLDRWARLGSMVYLATIGALLSPGAIHHVIIPAIVVAMILILGLVQCWLDRERPGLPWLVTVVIAHPFLYFLLYFSYASQAFGVVLFITGLLLANRADGPFSRHIARSAALAGVMFGCAALHYSSMPIATAVFGVIAAAIGLRNRRLAPVGLAAAAMLVTCGYYLPATVHELRYAANAVWGWDWTGLIGPLEFLGLRPVLGYGLPEPHRHRMAYIYVILAGMLLILLLRGVRRSRLRAESMAIVATTAFMASVALVKYFRHQGHPTHAFVKVISTFAIFVLLLALLPVSDWVGKLAARPRRLALVALMALFIGGQLRSLRRREMLLPWFSDDLIALVRRQLPSATAVQFGMRMPHELAAPLVRDMRLVIDSQAVLPVGSVMFVGRRDLSPSDAGFIVDHEGQYVAVRRVK